VTTRSLTPIECELETARRELAEARNDLHVMKRAHKALIEQHHKETRELQAALWHYLLTTGTALIASNEVRGHRWRIIDQALEPVHTADTLAGLMHVASPPQVAPEPGLRDYRSRQGT
jgi:two-component sensor histidine kinase